MKTVQIEVEELRDLLTAAYRYYALEQGGVDNWTWHDESISDFLDENRCETIDEIVEKDLKLYLEGE